MSDMLVKLYELKDHFPLIQKLKNDGIVVRGAMAYEKQPVTGWVKQRFGTAWASECDITFYRQPVSCVIAAKKQKIIGFGCYEATRRNFFGPIGVDEQTRGLGIGKAILLSCLYAMYQMGYGYAIIGSAGPRDFFEKVAGAVKISGSSPGIYAPPVG